jgi:hypothetical protein
MNFPFNQLPGSPLASGQPASDVPDAPDRDEHGDLYEQEDEIRPHTPEEAIIYADVMARLRRLMRAMTIAKFGIIALMFAIIWRFFGPGAE